LVCGLADYFFVIDLIDFESLEIIVAGDIVILVLLEKTIGENVIRGFQRLLWRKQALGGSWLEALSSNRVRTGF